MPAFSLPWRPPHLTVRLLPPWNAPLPIHTIGTNPAASAVCLAPCIFGAEILDQ